MVLLSLSMSLLQYFLTKAFASRWNKEELRWFLFSFSSCSSLTSLPCHRAVGRSGLPGIDPDYLHEIELQSLIYSVLHCSKVEVAKEEGTRATPR